MTLLFFVFSMTNAAAFGIMLWDKAKSRKSGAPRIPEGVLFFMAICFGAIGTALGMLLFRHKIRTWYFVLGIPLLICENTALVYLALEYFR